MKRKDIRVPIIMIRYSPKLFFIKLQPGGRGKGNQSVRPFNRKLELNTKARRNFVNLQTFYLDGGC